MRFLVSCLLIVVCLGAVQAAEKPNIIYIMSDDMGFSDIGCYGSEIDTPHLDTLAANGVRFTQFYNTARCCPTRACLLTGLYPHQAGVGHMMEDRGYDGYRGDLNRNCVTIPEALKSAGYKSYISGKWHVTKVVRPKTEEDKHNWPLQRGFDRFYGTIHGAGSFFDPNTLTRDNTYISPFADPEYATDEYYYTDAISDHAVRFIREHHGEAGDKPFFMYVAYTAAHWPMHALEKDLKKYKGKYDGGYQATRTQRYRRMLELGLVSEQDSVNWSLPDDWKEKEYWDWDKRNMEVYAAMIDNMDQGIGRIIGALKETGQFDNTLICFFQDNGGCAEGYGRGGVGQPRAELPPLKPLAADYLQPDMQPRQTRDGFPVRTGKGAMAGPADTYIGYGRGWATVSNTPFREYKHWVHEGGISTPLIVHWPQVVKRRGELETTPGHLIDLMATAVDVSGATYPVTYHNDQKIKPMEGKSLLPAFLGKEVEREAIYWEHEGNRAVRVGDYKLVAKGAKGAWELYHIAQDRSEQQDLSQQQPERVKRMAAMWLAYAERANVLPLNPRRNQQKVNFNKKQKKFAFKAGDQSSRERAPYVAKRGLTVSARVDAEGDGAIIAQGGVAHGWALYLRDGKLHFVTTVNGQRHVVRSADAVRGEHVVSAVLSKDATVELRVDGKVVGSAAKIALLTEQPLDGLQVGCDLNGNVGDYAVPFRFQGKVAEVNVVVTP